ncbi:MAG TPA: hypothetical protein V6C65_04045 [Allocoleopsis sp.]
MKTILRNEFTHLYIEEYQDGTIEQGDNTRWSYTIYFFFDEKLKYRDERIISRGEFLTEQEAIAAGVATLKAACSRRVAELHQVFSNYEYIRACIEEVIPTIGADRP